jgi:hypothetical protein
LTGSARRDCWSEVPWRVLAITPMRLLRVPEAFDHPDCVYEWKVDGFRALAYVDGHQCRLMSRYGRPFTRWPQLAEELAHAVRAEQVVLDGEICCLDADGRSNFNALLFGRAWPHFYAFDILSLDGRDLTGLPLLERKRLLRSVLPALDARLQYLDHVVGTGVELYRAICARDLEGIVAKWALGTYQTDGRATSWLKIKNPSTRRWKDGGIYLNSGANCQGEPPRRSRCNSFNTPHRVDSGARFRTGPIPVCLRFLNETAQPMKPASSSANVDGSGTGAGLAVKVPKASVVVSGRMSGSLT